MTNQAHFRVAMLAFNTVLLYDYYYIIATWYNMCSAWFLNIRISTCFKINFGFKGLTINMHKPQCENFTVYERIYAISILGELFIISVLVIDLYTHRIGIIYDK